MPRYQNKTMQHMYDTMLKLAADPNSELYYNGAQHRGAGHRCAFWDGFDGTRVNANAGEPQSMSRACYQAGKEWAKQCKKNGTPPPMPAARPYFAGK